MTQWLIVQAVATGIQSVPVQEGRLELVHLVLLANQHCLDERLCMTNACVRRALAPACRWFKILYWVACSGGAPGGSAPGAAGGPAGHGRGPLRASFHAQSWLSSTTFKSGDLFRRGAWRPYTWSCWRTSGAWTSACARRTPCAPPATVAAFSSPSCARTGSVRCALSPSAAP